MRHFWDLTKMIKYKTIMINDKWLLFFHAHMYNNCYCVLFHTWYAYVRFPLPGVLLQAIFNRPKISQTSPTPASSLRLHQSSELTPTVSQQLFERYSAKTYTFLSSSSHALFLQQIFTQWKVNHKPRFTFTVFLCFTECLQTFIGDPPINIFQFFQ